MGVFCQVGEHGESDVDNIPMPKRKKMKTPSVWKRELWRAQKWNGQAMKYIAVSSSGKINMKYCCLAGSFVQSFEESMFLSFWSYHKSQLKFFGGAYFSYLKEAFENVVNWCQFPSCVFEKRLTVRNASCLFWIQECRCAVKLSINTHSACVILGYCFEYIRCVTFGVVHWEPAHGW